LQLYKDCLSIRNFIYFFCVIVLFKLNVNSYLYSYISNIFNSRHSEVLLLTKLNILIVVS